MTRHRIYIKKYDWLIDFYLSARRDDVPVLLNELHNMGADDDALDDCACRLGCLNTGIAMSNPFSRHSLAVIAHASDAAEYFDTFAHELNHVCSSIEKEYDIDPHSEEACYLLGDIVRSIIEEIL